MYYENCTSSADGKTFHKVPRAFGRINNDLETGTDVGYDNATHDALPILTVHMPVANHQRTSFFTSAPSALQCVQVKDFSEGSRVSPALPEGTAWPSPADSLSTKAKGGIIAGVVVSVLLVGGLLFILWNLRRKKRRAREVAAARLAVAPSDGGEKLPPEADGSHTVHELSPKDKKPELDSASVTEMEGGEGRPPELETTEAPVELPAEIHGRRAL